MPPVADIIPAGLNPGDPPAQGLTDQMPFVAWEGTLVIYRDRFIVLTRDKIERALTSRPAVPSALPPSVIAIEYFDTALALDLEGKYVLYLEVQRL